MTTEIERNVIDKLDDRRRERKSGWFKEQLKLLPSFGIVLAFVWVVVWKVFAEPEVEKVVETSQTQLKKDIKETSSRSKQNQNEIREIKWEIKQVRFMLEESLPKEDVRRAKRRSELLRPDKVERN